MRYGKRQHAVACTLTHTFNSYRIHIRLTPSQFQVSFSRERERQRARVLATRRMRLQIDWKHFVRWQTKIHLFPLLATPWLIPLPSYFPRLFLACDWVNKHPWVSNKGRNSLANAFFSIYFCFGSRQSPSWAKSKNFRQTISQLHNKCPHKLTANCALALAANGVEPKANFTAKAKCTRKEK